MSKPTNRVWFLAESFVVDVYIQCGNSWNQISPSESGRPQIYIFNLLIITQLYSLTHYG